MEVVIEIVEPGRRAPSVKRFQKSEILVGRGWDADLVIADEEVDAHHLRLVFNAESSSFELEDLDSANGVRIKGQKLGQQNQVPFGTTLMVGQTIFRVHRPSDAVVPAKIHSRAEQALQTLGKPGIALLVAGIALFAQQYSSFMGSGAHFEWDNQLSSLLSVGMGLALWAIIWGGITKLFKHQMRIWAHLGLAAIVLIISIFLDEIANFFSFNILSPTANELFEAVNISLLIFLWISLGLIITANLKQRTRLTIASVLVGLFLVTSFLLPRFQSQSWVSWVPLDTTSLPPSLLLNRGKSEENFMALIAKNIEVAEESATKAREENLDEEEN